MGDPPRRTAGSPAGASGVTELDKEFLSILVCPLTKAKVVQVGDWLYSTDAATRRRYPIKDGIPIMLIDESEVVEPEEFKRIMAQAGQG
jgi:hypothetical protein